MTLARSMVLKTDNTLQMHRWVELNQPNATRMMHRVNLLNTFQDVAKAWIRTRDVAHAFR